MSVITIIGSDIPAYIAAIEALKHEENSIILINDQQLPEKSVFINESVKNYLLEELGEEGEKLFEGKNPAIKPHRQVYQVNDQAAVINLLNARLNKFPAQKIQRHDSFKIVKHLLKSNEISTDKGSKSYIPEECLFTRRIKDVVVEGAFFLVDAELISDETIRQIKKFIDPWRIAKEYLKAKANDRKAFYGVYEKLIKLNKDHDKGRAEALIKILKENKSNLVKRKARHLNLKSDVLYFYIDQVRAAYLIYKDNIPNLIKALNNIADDIDDNKELDNNENISKAFRQKLFHEYAEQFKPPQNEGQKSLYQAFVPSELAKANLAYAQFLYEELINDPELLLASLLNGNVVPVWTLSKKMKIALEKFNKFDREQQRLTVNWYDNFQLEKNSEAARKMEYVSTNDLGTHLQAFMSRTGKENREALEALIRLVGLIDIKTIKLQHIPLDRLPENLAQATDLEELEATDCGLSGGLAVLSKFGKLGKLNLSKNPGISSLPELPKTLYMLDICGTSIHEIPDVVLTLPNAQSETKDWWSLTLKLDIRQIYCEPEYDQKHPNVHRFVRAAINKALIEPRPIVEPANYPNVLRAIRNVRLRESISDSKAIIRAEFEKKIEKLPLEELAHLFQIMKHIQDENITDDEIEVESGRPKQNVENLVFLRLEQNSWLRMSDYGNTKSWQKVMRMIKDKMREKMADNFSKVGQENPSVNSEEQKYLSFLQYRTGRSPFGHLLETTSAKKYREDQKRRFNSH